MFIVNTKGGQTDPSEVAGVGREPAVTIGRAFSDTYAGHPRADVVGFIGAQAVRRHPGRAAFGWLVPASNRRAVSAGRQEAA